MNVIRRSILISIALLSFIACTHGPAAYEKAYLGMTVQDLLSSYADLKRVLAVPEVTETDVVEYTLPPDGNVNRSSFFIQDEVLVGMVYIFSTGQDFDYLANRLALKNGKPTQIKTVDATRGAHWRKSDSYIMLLEGITGTRIKLPIGETDEIKPDEIVLIIGEQPAA